MSNYRDDSQETATASDELLSGLSALVADAALIAGALFFTLGVLHDDSAVIAESVIGNVVTSSLDACTVQGLALDTLRARSFLEDAASISDLDSSATRGICEDSAAAQEAVTDTLRVLHAESAYATVFMSGSRVARDVLSESAKADSSLYRVARAVLDESALMSDEPLGVLLASSTIIEQFSAGDSLLGASSSAGGLAEDSATVSSTATGRLLAHGLSVESAYAEDRASFGVESGVVWTAGFDGWAMSRYVPWGIGSIAAIDGVLHAFGPDGVFALDGGDEPINARVLTGERALGGGVFARPSGAVLHHDLSGEVSVGVSDGVGSFEYPVETRASLQAGRSVFGRGLKGLGFTFDLKTTATEGGINDWRVSFTPTARRV